MKYNFDHVIDRRNTQSSKWEMNEVLFGREDVLDMWVADMDLPSPQPVIDAIKQRAEHPFFGYTFPSAGLYEAIINWVEKHYGWKIKKEWILFNAGVVNGLYTCIRALTSIGDEVIIQSPVYYPFYSAIRNTGRQVLLNPLRFDGERYTMDFEGLEELFKSRASFPARVSRAKMLILCSPHNPVGRVWTQEELTRLSEICLKYNCIVISDEIHCDLLAPGAKHTSTSTLSSEIEQNTLTLMSAAKTFNLAGLSTSFAIIPNDRWRETFGHARAGECNGNIFGLTALEAAYTHGEDYLRQLKDYIYGNFKYFAEYVESNMPELKVIKAEGTYLCWVDMRGLGMNDDELQDFIRNKARLALDDGYAFGPGGEGFQRFNLACPRAYVEEALRRLEAAIKNR